MLTNAKNRLSWFGLRTILNRYRRFIRQTLTRLEENVTLLGLTPTIPQPESGRI